MKRAWLLLGMLCLGLVTGGQAEIQGDCDVVINGRDAATASSEDRNDALRVELGDEVNYTISVGRAVKTFQLIASIASYDVILDDQNFTLGEQVSVINGNTTFEGLPGGASGLYRYRGEVTMWDGSDCTGAMLIHIVPASPLTPIIAGAVVVAAGSATLILLALIRIYQDTKEIVDVVKDYASESRKLIK